MEDTDIEQRFHLMQKGIEASASLLNQCRLDLVAAVDSLRIELEVLKSYLERYPDFSKSYPRLRQEAMQTIDPEWMASGRVKRVVE